MFEPADGRDGADGIDAFGISGIPVKGKKAPRRKTPREEVWGKISALFFCTPEGSVHAARAY